MDGLASTSERFKVDGQYGVERRALHRAILGELLNEQVLLGAAADSPTFIILGGRGGSGKGSFRDLIYDPAEFVLVDPDQIKAMLPEYEGWNAAEVHDEASDIAEAALTAARALKLNVVLDVTMRSATSAILKVRVFRRDGYRIEAHYMFLPRQTAARRALERFAGPSARYVPPDVILRNTTNEATFDLVKEEADGWSFWTNDVPAGEPPRNLAASSGP